MPSHARNRPRRPARADIAEPPKCSGPPPELTPELAVQVAEAARDAAYAALQEYRNRTKAEEDLLRDRSVACHDAFVKAKRALVAKHAATLLLFTPPCTHSHTVGEAAGCPRCVLGDLAADRYVDEDTQVDVHIALRST